jgi:hypothetical protein
MKGMRLETASLVQLTVMRELKVIWEEAFSQVFNLLYEQCKCYAKAGGDYIE